MQYYKCRDCGHRLLRCNSCHDKYGIAFIVELEYGSKVIVIYAKNIQPIILDNFVLPRATWPVTLAGAIVLWDTEIISGLILAQIVNPSLPIISGYSGGFTGTESDALSIQAPERSILIYIKTPKLFRNKHFQKDNLYHKK